MQFSKELSLAEAAAREAGALLRSHMQSEQTVLSQEGRDIKLQADRDAEALILARLAESGHAVLAEESGEHGDLAGDTLAWIVDPLDGTFNYSREIPVCAVSIGLCRGRTPLLGVIYDFNRDELFSGVVGEGAWLNGKPIRVTTESQTHQAVLCTGVPSRSNFSEESLLLFIHRIKSFKKVRLIGSAAVMLAYVACGRADAYLENEIMWWDVAAGLALIQAAGGWTEVNDSPGIPWGCRVRCAGNPAVWEQADPR